MSKKKDPGDKITANITGDISGQVAVGKNIDQTQTSISSASPAITEKELSELTNLISDLKAKVVNEAPSEKKDSASEKLDELETALTAKEPDLTTMEYVQNWFTKNLPTIAGSVTSLVVHPIVGKLVEAAGDVAVKEFRRRFGSSSK